MHFTLQKGYLQDPPNVDFLEVEVENNDKIGVRDFILCYFTDY